MSFTSKSANEVLVAGQQDTMFKIDVEKGMIIETVLEGMLQEYKLNTDIRSRSLQQGITPR
jgi:hypothetical protein